MRVRDGLGNGNPSRRLELQRKSWGGIQNVWTVKCNGPVRNT